MNYALSPQNSDYFTKEIEDSLQRIQLPCPQCSGKLILKTKCCHSFLGCDNSPNCDATMLINDSCLIALIKLVMEQLSNPNGYLN